MSLFRKSLVGSFMFAALAVSQNVSAVSTYELLSQLNDDEISDYIKHAVADDMRMCKSKQKMDEYKEIASWYVKHGGVKQIYESMGKDFKDARKAQENGNKDFVFKDLEKDILPSLMPVNCRNP